MHGGTSLVGPASPAFKHGRYSRYFIPRLLERYEIARNDPDLLSCRDEMAVIDTRISELLAALPSTSLPDVWSRALRACRALAAGMEEQNASDVAAAMVQLEGALESGQDDARAWAQIIGLITTRAKVAEVEARRLVALEAVVRLDDIVAMAAGIVQAVRKYVTDPAVLSRIVVDVESLLTRPGVT